MIFHEIYSVYYQAVAKILERAQQGQVSHEELGQIVSQTAFAESSMTILPALQKGQWQLLTPDGKTPIVHRPTMPLTLLQKQWLKALTLDPRFRLFGIELPGLEDIAPLFTPADFVVYDRYGDGDPYEDEGYIARFRLILRAIGEKRPLRLQIRNRKGSLVWVRGYGQRLEYSEKDDKFRLLLTDRRNDSIINLARITDCSLLPVGALPAHRMNKKQALELTLRIRNERNTLAQPFLNNTGKLSPNLGIPEIAIPIGYHSRGAGMGMEIAARKNEEQLLLNIAYAYTMGYDHREAPTVGDLYAQWYDGSLTDLRGDYYTYHIQVFVPSYISCTRTLPIPWVIIRS